MRFAILSTAVLAVGWTSALAAQDGPKKSQEPTTVVVEGKASLTVQDEKTATEKLNQIPGGVNLVPGEEVRRTRAADLEDVLQSTPGVYLSTRNGQEYRLSIRGSGLQRNFHLAGTNILEDGITLNWADGFGDFNMIDPRSMEYIEVYRGANAFELGSTWLGGAINFVSRTGRTAPAFDFRLEAGSWKYVNAQVAAAHVSGDFDVFVSAGHYSEEGYRPHSAFSTDRLAANAGYRIDDEWETRVYLDLVRTVAELPDTLTFDQVHHDRRASSFLAESQDWHRDLDSLRLADKTTWRSGDQQVEIGAYWLYSDLFHPIIWFNFLNLGIIDQLVNDVGLFARYSNTSKIAGQRNTLTAGIQSSTNRNISKRFTNPNGNPAGTTKTADGTTHASNGSIYVHDQMWLADPWSVVAGLNFTYTNRHFDDKFLTDTDGDQSFRAKYVAYTPTVGSRYQVTPDAQVFANVSRSFEPPQFIELLNIRGGGNGSIFYNPLRAQRATTAEIGTRGKEGRIAWELTYYYSWLHREIISEAPFPGASVATNANRTAHQGIELGVDATLVDGVFAAKTDKKVGDRFYLRPIYTWSHFKFRNDPVYGNGHLPGIPEHLILAELGYQHPVGAFIALNLEWVPFKYPSDYANSFNADRYATWGIKAGYRRDTGVSFFVEVRNLTDQRYVNSVNQVADAGGVDGANFHPGYARAYYAGMEVRW